MSAIFTLGKIVKASTFDEAKDLFARRVQLGIGGVIFTPPIYVPEWPKTVKERLGKREIEVNPDTFEIVTRCDEDIYHKEIAGQVAMRLVRISKEFNESTRIRKVRFYESNDLNVAVHRDKIAKAGFLHLHWEGEGLICLNPVGPEKVNAFTTDPEQSYFDHSDIRRLFDEGKIEAVILEERQAIIFDDTMVHMSAQGQRFRMLAMG